ncbi:MAG: hypothetical protein JXB13_19550 [Phycisphaerae bacterium]|nr:hypothetical protein [Phycisphaerae bacterium]
MPAQHEDHGDSGDTNGDAGKQSANQEQPYVRLGVPGLDEVFRGVGVRQGSVILISGPPGSGKTLLTFQLLGSMQLAGHENDGDARAAMLWTADEREDRLEQQLPGFITVKRRVEIQGLTDNLDTLRKSLVKEWYDSQIRQVTDTSRIIVEGLERWFPMPTLGEEGSLPFSVEFILPPFRDPDDSVERRAREEAVKWVLERVTFRPQRGGEWEAETNEADYCAVGVDGLLNLSSLRGRNADERRGALREAASSLRRFLMNNPSYLAAILTAETPPSRFGERITQVEEYLADVVIRLNVEGPTPGKRRRTLEIPKSRYTEAILGEHSLWIVGPDEAKERAHFARSLYWSKSTVDHFKPGIVVFPRLRWRLDRGGGPVSTGLNDVLLQLRELVEQTTEGRALLREPGLRSTVAAILAERPTDDVLESLIEYLGRVLHLLLVEDETTRERTLTALDSLVPQDFAGAANYWSRQIDWERVRKALDAFGALRAKPGEREADDESNPGLRVARVLGSHIVNWLGEAGDPTPRLTRILAEGAYPFADLPDELRKWIPDWAVARWRAFVGFALCFLAEIGAPTSSQKRYCAFGVDGLDEMFGSAGADSSRGVTRASSTLLVGGPGTGKSTLAYSFILRGFLDGEDVIFLSFDERHKRILRGAGNLCVRKEDNLYSAETFADLAARHVLEADSNEEGARFRFIHQNPVNADLDQITYLLSSEMRHGAPRPGHRTRPCRLVIDSLSDLERNIRDPLVFNDFVITLLNKAIDWQATVLITYEAIATMGAGRLCERSLSFLADNVVLLQQVEVNNVIRKAVTIQKARGRDHEQSAREMAFDQYSDGRLSVQVRKGFEGMTSVLTGDPKPARIEMRLFHENDPERRCNERLVADLSQRFGREIRYIPFTLAESRRMFWERERGRDVRPDADVTVVSLDQPWVGIFSHAGDRQVNPCARLRIDENDKAERLLLTRVDEQLLDQARIRTLGGDGLGARELTALPHYYDLGLLLYRPDLVASMEALPTHWDLIIDTTGFTTDCVEQINQRSFEAVVTKMCNDRDVSGFAFNMMDVETVACFFLEMCWNFFCDPDFLVNQTEQGKNLQRATEAMAFLARLRRKGALAPSCRMDDFRHAVFSRVWYANLSRVMATAEEASVPSLKPIPFFVSSRQFQEGFVAAELRCHVDGAIAKTDRACESISKNLDASANSGSMPDAMRTYEDRCRLGYLREAKDRLEHRLADLRHEEHHLSGWACSGAWYLGVLSSPANANLGWSLLQEALSNERVEDRAFAGAGLPVTRPFYQDHGGKPVPQLANTTFGELRQRFFGRTRSRERALGIAPSIESPRRLAVNGVEVIGGISEVLYGIVKTILENEEFWPNEEPGHPDGQARQLIEHELAGAFSYVQQAFEVR